MNPGRGSFQSANVRTGMLPRIAGFPAPLACRPPRRGARLCEQPIDRRGTRADQLSANDFVESQMPMPLERRDQQLQPLAADPIGGFPKDDERLAHRSVVDPEPVGSPRNRNGA